MRNLAKSYPWSSNFLKNQRFNAIDGSIEILKNSWISKNEKWKILKQFTRPKQWAALRKLFSTPQVKDFLHFWNKNVLAKTSRYIQTFTLQVSQECSSWESRNGWNGAMQMFFPASTRNMFAGKFVKWVMILAVLQENIF